MNLLIDLPPTTVMIGGTEYEINSDFRASILFELMLQDNDVPRRVQAVKGIEIYFPEYPRGEALDEIWEAIRWFYTCGRSDKELARLAEEHNESDGGGANIAYSFEYDDEYIYAAFRQQYGLNLSTVEYLHWWEFRAMFKSLTGDCQFSKIVSYRTQEITKDMSARDKATLRKLKRIYALPLSESEMRRNNALVEALMNGGDLTGLIGDDISND